MNTIRYALWCQYGTLGHGTLEQVQAEQNRFGTKAEETWIKEFDFRTHHILGNEIVPRETPLTFYSAKRLLEMKTIRTERDLFGWTELWHFDVPNIEGFRFDEVKNFAIQIEIIYEDHYNTLATVWFESIPFMIAQKSGDDDRNVQRFITNEYIYWKTVNYLSQLSREPCSDVIDLDEVRIDLTCFGGVEIVSLNRS